MGEIIMKKSISEKKIMIVDDHPLLRQGIKKVIDMEKDLKVCSEAASANDAIDQIIKYEPDVIIIDITLSGNVNGIELIKTIRQRYPKIYTIVLTMHDESIYGERSLRAGARGYVVKEVASKNIVQAIRTVLNGDMYISEELSKKIVGRVVHDSGDTVGLSIENLTDREFEIFHLIGNGFSTKEIAGKFNISIFTVESHKKKIKEKLNFKDSPELIKNAIQWIIMQSKNS